MQQSRDENRCNKIVTHLVLTTRDEMEKVPAARSYKNILIRHVLNLIIVIFITTAVITGTPEMNFFHEKVKSFLHPLSFAIGIWPSWSMFAPNPARVDSKTFAEIHLRSGKVKELDIEPQYGSGFAGHLRDDRWRKFSGDNLKNANHRAVLPLIINYLHKKFNPSMDPITKVRLIQRWSEVSNFGDGSRIISLKENSRRIVKENILFEKDY